MQNESKGKDVKTKCSSRECRTGLGMRCFTEWLRDYEVETVTADGAQKYPFKIECFSFSGETRLFSFQRPWRWSIKGHVRKPTYCWEREKSLHLRRRLGVSK